MLGLAQDRDHAFISGFGGTPAKEKMFTVPVEVCFSNEFCVHL